MKGLSTAGQAGKVARGEKSRSERIATAAHRRKGPLSLEDCRALLPPGEVSDAEVERIRDDLYALAEILVTAYLEQKDHHDTGDHDDQALRDVRVG